MRLCFRCLGLTWIGNCDVDDGMMTGRDTCPTCHGEGEVDEESVVNEVARVLSRAPVIPEGVPPWQFGDAFRRMMAEPFGDRR